MAALRAAALCGATGCAGTFSVPSIPLRNAAVPGVTMPAMGLGTAGYQSTRCPAGPNGTMTTNCTGECWDDVMVVDVAARWFALGGRRVDGASSYFDQKGLGKAIEAAIAGGLPRRELFVVSKVDPPGTGEGCLDPFEPNVSAHDYTMHQWWKIKSDLRVDYVDLLLMHWPGALFTQPAPACGYGMLCACNETSFRRCARETWAAMTELFHAGSARAIGVANWEKWHIDDLVSSGALVPSVNQVEYHPYWHEDTLREHCTSLGIHFQSYAPLGAPDHMASSARGDWKYLIPEHPAVARIAARHNCTPAQAVLQWHWQRGISTQPRTLSEAHMRENLGLWDLSPTGFPLDPSEVAQIDDLPDRPPHKNFPSWPGVPPGIPGMMEDKVCPDPNSIP